MGRMDWDLDLREGLAGESFLISLLETVEVKTDSHAGRTGNVFVEKFSRFKESGILTTKAKYWAFVLDGQGYAKDTIIIVLTEKLKQIITTKKPPLVGGGDQGTSTGYLIRISWLTEAT